MNSNDKQANMSMMPDEDPACPLLRAQLAELEAEKTIIEAQIAAVKASLQSHGCNQAGGGAG